MKILILLSVIVPLLVLPLASALRASNFTSYIGDFSNSTAMIDWAGKYCNLKFNSTEPAKSAYIAKDGDPRHTTVCNKTYNTAIDIISNNINSDTEKIDKQGKHCEKVSNTIDEMRTCMGLS